jgi:hypothetical protein
MIGSQLPRYSQPRPTIGPAEITKQLRWLAHIPVINLASDAVAPHDPSMLELLGIDPRDTTNQYIKAIRDFIKDGAKIESSYKTLLAITGSKWLLTRYAPTVAERFLGWHDAAAYSEHTVPLKKAETL